ncbi:MAG: ArsA family ATPase, partial [Acidimicrobiia bacterium]
MSVGLEGLLASREVAVVCGPGGVGKTSIAAATAAGAAAHLGGRVLIVTIDPARRLASALGLRGIGNAERRIPPAALARVGLEARGGLWAVQLDTKRSWDDLIRRHAPDDAAASRILSNRLYHTLSSWSAEGHEYLAMERLYEIHAAGRYDLVVVDTPPTRHALDFVEAPRRMADFITGRLVRLLTLPYRRGPARG